MRKIITAVAFLLAIALISPQVTAADEQAGGSAILQNQITLPQTDSSDLRIVAVKNVLSRHNSPLVDKAEVFVKTADQYNVDWKLLPSISGVESSFGIALLTGSYNAYGWGGGTIYFKNWDDGINTIDKSLREDYINRLGTDNVYSIGSMYAESPTWASRVSGYEEEFNDEYFRLTSAHLKLTI